MGDTDFLFFKKSFRHKDYAEDVGVCVGGVVFLWTLRRVFPAAYLNSPWICALTQTGQDVVGEIGNKKCTFYTQHTYTQTCSVLSF